MTTKTKLLLVTTLAGALVSAPAWARHDLKLVIEPGIPDTSQTVTITVTDSACTNFANVVHGSPTTNSIQIQMSFPGAPYYQQCLDENPDAPNFETTVGPLEPGDYAVALIVRPGGAGLTDVVSFSVVDAPPVANLSEGGINGLYHDQQAPHRYLYVLETDYTTLVVWNTFDPEGNQLWVYGVGDLSNDGSTVIAQTYINTSSGFLPNGEADDDVQPWGFIRVDLASCLEGTVTYHSDLPEFGSGQFSIVRLANAKQIGCVDSE